MSLVLALRLSDFAESRIVFHRSEILLLGICLLRMHALSFLSSDSELTGLGGYPTVHVAVSVNRLQELLREAF